MSPPHHHSMDLLVPLLETVLFGTRASFTHPGILLPQAENITDSQIKDIIRQTQRSREARETLGFSPKTWDSLAETLAAGNDQLLDSKHHLLPKIWDLAILGRNLLAAKQKAQDLSTDRGFEAEIRRMATICIEKCNKPAATNTDNKQQEKEFQLKSGYKKVLITAFQFLNNVMSRNEARKLHLWLHMFGTPASVSQTGSTGNAMAKTGTQKSKPPQSSVPAQAPVANGEADATANGGSNGEMAAKCNTLSANFNGKYYKPGFLVDAPRLLQPDEMEPLLMILQQGVSAIDGSDPAMQAVRCKLLLAQGYGRTLLREVLVHLGAWEIEEEDNCFRFVSQVVEAILRNGLIPYTYEALREEKEVITPAQSVLLKILGSVYKPTGAEHTVPEISEISPLPESELAKIFPASAVTPELISTIAPVESSLPTYFINTFKKQVFPYLCRIIRLQGEIIRGTKSKDEFEISLWDIDRLYEGTTAFMDLFLFFAAKDRRTSKLLKSGHTNILENVIKLLAELDSAHAPYNAAKEASAAAMAQTQATAKAAESKETSTAPQSKYMVERPFDVFDPSDGVSGPVYEDDDELTEASHFSWPNLKRMCINLIGNLAWEDPAAQDLCRERGGLPLILNNIRHDDDNPFINQHSIFTLRILLKDNLKNQEYIERLEPVNRPPEATVELTRLKNAAEAERLKIEEASKRKDGGKGGGGLADALNKNKLKGAFAAKQQQQQQQTGQGKKKTQKKR